jgi:hypothetical protein
MVYQISKKSIGLIVLIATQKQSNGEQRDIAVEVAKRLFRLVTK